MLGGALVEETWHARGAVAELGDEQRRHYRLTMVGVCTRRRPGGCLPVWPREEISGGLEWLVLEALGEREKCSAEIYHRVV